MLAMLRRTAVAPSLFAGAAGAFWLHQHDGAAMGTLTAQADAAKGALDPTQFKPFKLIEKERLSHNTSKYTFELPKGETAGLSVASCLVVRAFLKDKPEDAEPKAVIRPYTPTSHATLTGALELVVKTYPDGKISKHLDSLKVGDSLDIKGPIPKYPYEANAKKKIGMLAGGTGIAPMWQVAYHILSNPADKTEVSLVFANISEADILIKDLLDGLAKKHPKQFKVHYLVDKPKDAKAWKGGVGYISADVIKQHMPAPGPDMLIFVCGPPGQMNALSGNKESPAKQGELKGALKDLGYTAEQVYKF